MKAKKQEGEREGDEARVFILTLAFLVLISSICRNKLGGCLYPFTMMFESLGPQIVLPDHLVDCRQYILLDSKSTEDSKGSFQSSTNQKR